MADNTIINCSTQGNIFIGVTECGSFNTGDYYGTLISRKGTKIPNDTTFLTKLKEAVQKNLIIPFKGYDYRNNHEENQVNTSSIGNMQLQRLGKPMFEVDLTSSICEMKAISKVNNTSDRWDFWLVYENAIVCATASDGSFVGFDCNMIQLESTKLKQGSDLQMKTMKAQLKSSTQYNEGMTLIPITEALAEVKELAGIVEVGISVTITNGTTLAVKVVDKCSGNGIEGLTTIANFQVLGTQATATDIDAIVSVGDGVYTFTLDPTLVSGDTIGIKLATSTTESVLIDGVYYGGSSELKTMV
jgi:hypothetical protein